MKSLGIFVFFALSRLCNSSSILAIFPSPRYGQYILGEQLVFELVRRGHSVTLISAYKPAVTAKNLKVHYLDTLADQYKDQDLFEYYTSFIISNYYYTLNFGFEVTEKILSHKEISKVFSADYRFDVVILDYYFNEALMAFASYYKAPLILFSSIGPSEWTADYIGNLHLPSMHTNSLTPQTNEKGIFENLVSTYVSIYIWLWRDYYIVPFHQKLINKHFMKLNGVISNIIYNVSLVLLNSDPVVGDPHHLTQASVEIGGFHIKPKPLRGEFEKIVQKSNDIVLISMGASLNMKYMESKHLKTFIKTISRFREFQFIWKLGNVSNHARIAKFLPGNVHITSWVPQIDILAHPKTRAFITSGGLQSVTEAVYFGVPMVAIPIFGDQFMNIARAVRNGVAVKVDYNNLGETTLFNALNSVFKDLRIRAIVRRRGRLLKNKPIAPMNLAIYWIEYIIRHNGAYYLRNSVIDMNFLSKYCAETVCILIVLFGLAYGMIYGTYLLICCTCCEEKQTIADRQEEVGELQERPTQSPQLRPEPLQPAISSPEPSQRVTSPPGTSQREISSPGPSQPTPSRNSPSNIPDATPSRPVTRSQTQKEKEEREKTASQVKRRKSYGRRK